MNNRIDYSSPHNPPNGRGDPFGSLRTRAAGSIGRALALVAGAAVLVATLFVSAIVFSVLLVAGVVAGGLFWWKTRGLRRELGERLAQMQRMQQGHRGQQGRMQEGPADPAGSGRAPGDGTRAAPGDVIEGDFIRETGSRR